LASVPKLPPINPSVVFEPTQIGDTELAEEAGEDKVLTKIVMLTHVVLLHNPSPLTQ
jgi:hypothetical protein